MLVVIVWLNRHSLYVVLYSLFSVSIERVENKKKRLSLLAKAKPIFTFRAKNLLVFTDSLNII